MKELLLIWSRKPRTRFLAMQASMHYKKNSFHRVYRFSSSSKDESEFDCMASCCSASFGEQVTSRLSAQRDILKPDEIFEDKFIVIGTREPRTTLNWTQKTPTRVRAFTTSGHRRMPTGSYSPPAMVQTSRAFSRRNSLSCRGLPKFTSVTTRASQGT
jgi:hypothetical protein